MTSARRLSIAIVLLVLGAALLFLATSQVWFSGSARSDELGTSHIEYRGSGQHGLAALALGGLAAAAALIATGGRARVTVAAITGVLALGLGAVSIHAIAHRDGLLSEADPRLHPGGLHHQVIIASERTTGWPYIAVAAGVLMLLGALTAATAARGGGSLSSRYEPPAAGPPTPAAHAVPGAVDVAAWQALDRDEDPTGG